MAVYTNFWEGTGAVYVYDKPSAQTPSWPSSQPTIIESPTIKTGNREPFSNIKTQHIVKHSTDSWSGVQNKFL